MSDRTRHTTQDAAPVPIVALCGEQALLELWVLMLSQYGCGCFQRSNPKDLPDAVGASLERHRIRVVVMPSWDVKKGRENAGKEHAEGPGKGTRMSSRHISYARKMRNILGPDARIALAVPHGSAEPDDSQRQILLEAKIVRWPVHEVVVRVLQTIEAGGVRTDRA